MGAFMAGDSISMANREAQMRAAPERLRNFSYHLVDSRSGGGGIPRSLSTR